MLSPVLRVASLQVRGIFSINENDNPVIASGMDGQLLNCLAEKLHFQYDIHLAADGQWGQKDDNGTWSGIIGMLVRGEADIGIAWLSITEERSHVVDFSAPYFFVQWTFVTEAPEYQQKVEAFTYPFSQEVWILCFIMTLTFTLYAQRHSFVKFLVTFITLVGSLVNQSLFIRNIQSPAKRIVWGIWFIFSGIMPFMYSVSLLSFLTVPERHAGLENFEDLSKAVEVKTFKAFVEYGTYFLEFLLQSTVEYLRALGQNIKINGWFFSRNRSIDYAKSVAFIASKQTFELGRINSFITNKVFSTDSLAMFSIGIALRKGFCCMQRLNTVIHRMVSGGLVNKWFEDEVFFRNKSGHSSPPTNKNAANSLNLDDLKYIFGILILGNILGLIVLFFEILSKSVLKVRLKKKISFWK